MWALLKRVLIGAVLSLAGAASIALVMEIRQNQWSKTPVQPLWVQVQERNSPSSLTKYISIFNQMWLCSAIKLRHSECVIRHSGGWHEQPGISGTCIAIG